MRLGIFYILVLTYLRTYKMTADWIVLSGWDACDEEPHLSGGSAKTRVLYKPLNHNRCQLSGGICQTVLRKGLSASFSLNKRAVIEALLPERSNSYLDN